MNNRTGCSSILYDFNVCDSFSRSSFHSTQMEWTRKWKKTKGKYKRAKCTMNWAEFSGNERKPKKHLKG